jgi:thiol-disulfide isomerase/thioredoxin
MAIRMSRKAWVIVAMAIVAVGVIVGITMSCNSASPSDFTFSIITWNETTLSALEGTPVVLNFWSISCAYCRRQLPYLESVAQQSEGEIEVMAVNIADSAASVRSFFGDYEPAMTIALDNDREAFKDYCVAHNNTRGYIPFTLFVDSEGIVRYVKIGAFASEEALRDTLHDVFGITIP